MTIKLDNINFVSDFYSVTLEDGSTLYLNRLDEYVANESFSTEIKGINIEVVSLTGEKKTPCPCIIGLGNELISIETEHTEYLGKELTEDNMKYCTVVTNTND